MKRILAFAFVAMVAVGSYGQSAKGVRSERKAIVPRVMTVAQRAENAKQWALEKMRAEKNAAVRGENGRKTDSAVAVSDVFATKLGRAVTPQERAVGTKLARAFAPQDQEFAPQDQECALQERAVVPRVGAKVNALAANNEPIVIPEGLETETWYGRGAMMYNGSVVRYMRTLSLGFDGADVYVQGIFEDFPEAWIKGTIEDGVATFKCPQYIGKYAGSYDFWAAGMETTPDYDFVLVDFRMSYDAEAKAFTAINDIVANASEVEVYYLAWIRNLKITEKDPTVGPTTVPYFNTLETEELMEEMSVIDANSDGSTWTFYNTEGARYGNSSNNDADDWLITRGIELKAGKAYSFGFDVRASGYTERIEVKMGKEATAEAMTTEIVPAFTFENTEYETVENDRIVVNEDGVYYFGVHAISDADMYAIYLRNVRVDEGLMDNSPAAVSGVTIVPAADASNVATITFDAPSVDVSGTPLGTGTTLTVKAFRGEELVKEVACAVGQKSVTFTDEVPEAAMYSYKLITYAGELRGDKVVMDAWIGLDIPAEVTNVKMKDKLTSILTTWDPVTSVGANGGVVLPETTRYNLCTVEDYEFWGMIIPIVGEPVNPEPLAGTAYDYEINTCEGVQRLETYAVRAENATGKNSGAMIDVLLGAPYELIVHEGFGGNLTHYWDYSSSSDFGGVGQGKEPSDDDGGNIELYSVSDETEVVQFKSGKIHIGEAQHAMLCFDAKKDGACTEIVRVMVLRAGENEAEEVATLDLTNKYEQCRVPLTEYQDEPWIRFYIEAQFDGEGIVSVDNITVLDLVEKNVSVAISAPAYVTAGKTATVTAVVQNDGEKNIDGYAVKVYAGETMFAEFGAEKAVELAMGKSVEYEATWETSLFDEGGELTFRAEVTLEGDIKPEDNSAEVVTTEVKPVATPVATLDAQTTEEGTVVVWTKAESAVAEIVEDFESYAGNSIYADGEYCGAWKAVDVSKGENYGWSNRDIQWPHTWKVFAFGIVDTKASCLDTKAQLSALSGVNALGFFSEVNVETGDDQRSDRYVVSPELPGMAQNIVFGTCVFTNAYGAETYEVLASATDTELASFVKVAEFKQTELGWQTISVRVPEGTKYFAIHYTTPCAFGMLVDDINYVAGGATLTGYNIYVDRVKVASVGADVTTYTFRQAVAGAMRKAEASGKHTISVTAVYGNSESEPRTVEVDEVTAVGEVEGVKGATEIFSLDGKRISGKATKGVYVINGKTSVVK